jgi:hypothetical protein
MIRTSVAFLAGAFVAAGIAPAQHDGHGKVKVKVLSVAEVTEKIDGKKAKATTVEVTLGPGQASAPHRHLRAPELEPVPKIGRPFEGAEQHLLTVA